MSGALAASSDPRYGGSAFGWSVAEIDSLSTGAAATKRRLTEYRRGVMEGMLCYDSLFQVLLDMQEGAASEDTIRSKLAQEEDSMQAREAAAARRARRW